MRPAAAAAAAAAPGGGGKRPLGSAPGKHPAGGNPGAATGGIPAAAAAACEGEVDAAVMGGEGAEKTDDVGECAEWKEAMVSHTGGMVGHFSPGVRCTRGSLTKVPIFAPSSLFDGDEGPFIS